VWCESCGGDRLAEVQVGRPWLGLGAVPLVPIGRSERRVRCTACAGDLPHDALDQPTTAALAQHLAVATRALAVAITATGDPDDEALFIRALAQVRMVAPEVDAARLAHEVATCDPSGVPALVAPLASVLSMPGKELVVADLARVALASHVITARQRTLLDAVGRELGLGPADVCRIVVAAAAAVEPPAGT
jgi:hypothetical protein